MRAFVSQNNRDLVVLAEMGAGGTLRPVVERSYPLDEALDAIRHVTDGHTRGKVVITMQDALPAST